MKATRQDHNIISYNAEGVSSCERAGSGSRACQCEKAGSGSVASAGSGSVGCQCKKAGGLGSSRARKQAVADAVGSARKTGGQFVRQAGNGNRCSQCEKADDCETQCVSQSSAATRGSAHAEEASGKQKQSIISYSAGARCWT